MISAVQSSHWAPLPRPDSQTWTSSCEPSVRCVRSQWGSRAPITAAPSGGADSLSLPLITHMPVSHLSAAPTDLRAVGFQQLSAFVSASLKALTAAGELTLHQWGSCVLSCPGAACLLTMWEKKLIKKKQSIPPDWTMLPCSVVPKSSDFQLSFCGVTTDSLSTKALVKESEEPQPLHPLSSLPFIILSCPENLRPGVEGFLFSFCSIIPSAGYFHLQCNTSEPIFPWKLL